MHDKTELIIHVKLQHLWLLRAQIFFLMPMQIINFTEVTVT